MLAHVRQPHGSFVCGQACVAMVKGITLDDACALFGHRRKTRTRELVAALGDAVKEPKLQVRRHQAPRCNLAIMRLVRLGGDHASGGHWVVFDKGWVFDPALPTEWDFYRYRDEVLPGIGMRHVSYLPLRSDYD